VTCSEYTNTVGLQSMVGYSMRCRTELWCVHIYRPYIIFTTHPPPLLFSQKWLGYCVLSLYWCTGKNSSNKIIPHLLKSVSRWSLWKLIRRPFCSQADAVAYLYNNKLYAWRLSYILKSNFVSPDVKESNILCVICSYLRIVFEKPWVEYLFLKGFFRHSLKWSSNVSILQTRTQGTWNNYCKTINLLQRNVECAVC